VKKREEFFFYKKIIYMYKSLSPLLYSTNCNSKCLNLFPFAIHEDHVDWVWSTVFFCPPLFWCGNISKHHKIYLTLSNHRFLQNCPTNFLKNCLQTKNLVEMWQYFSPKSWWFFKFLMRFCDRIFLFLYSCH